MNKPIHDVGTDFVWFMGVVEDRNDPLQIGRVRVRTHYQTADKDILPTSDLPWAQITVPASAGTGDTGASSTGYVEGSWVVGFFMDGKQKQHPLIFGSISGFPTKLPDITQGFNDPRGVYPQRIYEPDVNRLVRSQTISKDSSAEAHPSIAFRNQYVDDLTGEPIPARSTEYPYAKVTETESGHIEEWDDTLGSERISFMHRTGSLQEFHPDGSKVDRIMKDNYHIVYGDDYVRVRGQAKVYIDGDASLYVRGKLVTQVDGDMETHVTGNYSLDVGGNIDVTTDGMHSIEAKLAMRQITNSTYSINAKEQIDISSVAKLLMQSQESLDISTPNNFSIKSGGSIYISTDSGGDINLYSGRNIFGFYCDDTEFYKQCIFISPTDIIAATVTAPDALVLESYITTELPAEFEQYSRKLDVGKGFVDIYNPNLGSAPGGVESLILDIKTIQEQSGENTSSSSYNQNDYTASTEAITTDSAVGNTEITGANILIDINGENSTHRNVLDLALSAKNIGPNAWIDGDARLGRSLYANPGNPRILQIFDEMGCLDIAKSINPSRYDKTAWCSAFVSAMLRRSGNKYLKTLSSRAFERNANDVGTLISTTYEPDKMKPGDILVFGRSGKSGQPFKSSPYGHVGIWTGNTNVPAGKVQCLGGNQSNKVTIRNFSVLKGTEFGIVAVIRPVSILDGKTNQPSPGAFREVTADQSGTDRVT
jgi:hypothetical protein